MFHNVLVCLLLILTKHLLRFIRNNWRIKVHTLHKPGYNVRSTDVVWWTHREAVDRQLAEDLGVDTADSSTPGWFKQRVPACKKVMENLTSSQAVELKAEIEKYKRQGLPREVQNK